MLDLTGRTAIITGASEGIGRELTRALGAQGMQLALAARSAERLAMAAAELESAGVRALAIPTDVTRLDDLQRLVQQTRERWGGIDVLVNSAGIESYHHFQTLPLDRIQATIDVNLTAALLLCRLVLPVMLQGGRGHIVNMSSTAGKRGPAYGAAYGASKAGLIALTQSLRSEYHGSGVSASVICPGFADDGGMYERIKQQAGRESPRLMGSTNSRAIARAVVQAIQRDLPELLVNRPPLRPFTVLAEMFPRWGEKLMRRASIRFLRRIAESRASADDASG